MKKIYSLFLMMVLFAGATIAQKTLTGMISDAASKEALIGANVALKGTNTVVTTDVEGKYTIRVGSGTGKLVVSYVGYETQEIELGTSSTLDIALKSSGILETVSVIGSRSTAARTRTETVAPVDVLDNKLLTSTGQTEPTQMMHYIAPSFNSSRQTVADGTDHIDPATLRGLGPDQVLMLVNSKRRHNQALININGTVGRGSVGTDMNSIPTAAIERLEVLRDGASSQYGSDAIAGVVNVVMKTSVGTSVAAHYGAYNTEYEPTFGATDKRKMNDGQMLQASVYHGMNVGKGKLSVAVEFRDRKASNRTGDFLGTVYNATKAKDDSIILAKGGFDRTFNMQVGNSSSQNILGMVNFSMPIGDNMEFYLNAGGASRKGAGKGFYRYPKQNTQVIPELYPNGFLPEIHSSILDLSALAGVKGTLKSGWRWDLSNVFGSNNFRFDVKNSNNASQFAQKAAAQKEFYAGTQKFAQNTLNFDIAKNLEIGSLKSFNLAGGAEFRTDIFGIEAGEDASWKNYDLAAKPLRVGGSQVFPGFQPSNEVNESRTVLGAYVDVESDITDKLLVDAAARIENYSDFGANFAGKLAARYKFADAFVLRGAVSNGFRAPSMHQRYFSNTSTQFVVSNGLTIANNVGTFRNDGTIAAALGIPSLKAEKSTNTSIGVTSKLFNVLTLTVDAYQINIKDRIVITGNMARNGSAAAGSAGKIIDDLLDAAKVQDDVTQVAFFTNAIDTKTQGVDIVLGASPKIGKGTLDFMAAANFTKNELSGTTRTTDKLPADVFGKTFFSRLEESRILVGQPRQKIAASIGYRIAGFNVNVRGTQFGEVAVWDATNTLLDEKFSPKTIIDASIGYKFNVATITLGANNVTDVYPDKIVNKGNTSDGRFIYSRNVTQFGTGGRYIYAALRIDIGGKK